MGALVSSTPGCRVLVKFAVAPASRRCDCELNWTVPCTALRMNRRSPGRGRESVVSLSPMLAKLIQAGFLEVVRRHDHAELDVGVEGQKPRLGQRRDFRRVGHVNDEHGRALTILFGEIDRLGPHTFENTIELGPDGT